MAKRAKRRVKRSKAGQRNKSARRSPIYKLGEHGAGAYQQLDSVGEKKMAKRKKTTKRKKTRSAAQRAATARMLAANKRKRGGKRKKARKSGPTKFQAYLMRDPSGAKKKMGW